MTSKTILIAEDDSTLRAILMDKLTQSGYAVRAAENGEVAMDLLHSGGADLVLLDILMPKKNGMEVLEEMHKDPSLQKIPVIIISNSGQPVEIEKAQKLGAKDFLIKAVFDPKEVLEKVNAVFGIGTTTPSPKLDQTNNQQTQPMATPKRAQSGSPILVVEDDKFLRELLIEKLISSGNRVLGATEGSEAFKILETEVPSLIVLDIILPDINGFEILAKIRSDKKLQKIPVMILSNLDQKEDLDRAHALGVSGFLIKANFSLGEIVAKIHSIIEGEKK